MIELKGEYQRDEFLKFISDDFLSDFNRDIRQVNTTGLTSIQKASYLGESKSLDLQVFEFFYDGSSNKRVALTKDAFSVMRSSAIFKTLAVFKSTDSDDWRFSLLTATPEATEKGKVAVSYSNPKRLSFFLGPNAKINTPTKFLISKGKVADFEDLKSRFSIEVVNKEFYKEISHAFTKLVGGMLMLPDSTDKSQTNLEFAVRLIGRIIFCWFLKEKKSHAGLGLMSDDLLSVEAINKNSDYYHFILEPIFFEILNKPLNDRNIEKFRVEPYSLIPYLNGGLFSNQHEDYYELERNAIQTIYHNILIVPDEWLKDFFAILETYNFTIDENTSYDEELSIDPEMLGRIFENLLAEINPETGESARKSTGSYYTPRIIVDYMVDESLLLYLKQQTEIKEEKLKAVISYELTDDVDNPITLEEREKIVNALEKVKILDPACGSGAFPIGALQKIVFILQQVDPDGSLWFKKQLAKASPEFRKDIEKKFSNKEFDFLRKLGVIRECIYGVDIQPIATEISRLRCFLTLIVDEHIDDEEENRGIKPLPNLDFKFVTANSLIGLPKIESSDVEQQSLLPDNKDDIDELKNIRDRYFTSSGIEREQLKTAFAEQQNILIKQFFRDFNLAGTVKNDFMQKITDWKPFTHQATDWFDTEWMFGLKEGFDIVIGNPPYGTSIKDQNREFVIKSLGRVPDYEIYYYFLEIAKKLLRKNGINSYIIPNTFLFNVFATEYRKGILENWFVNIIIDCTSFKLFESATVYNVIAIFSKSIDSNLVGYKNTLNAEQFEDLLKRETLFISKEMLISNNTNWGLVFKLSQKTLNLIKKIKFNSQKTDSVLDISQGFIPYRRSDLIKEYGKECGNNIVDERAWHSDTKKSTEYIREIYGKSLGKYSYKLEESFFKYGKHIASYVDEKFFKQRRLLIREITNPYIISCIVEDEAVNDPQIINVINKNNTDRLNLMCGILNSKLATFYHFNSSPKATKGAFPKILVKDIKEFPFPKIETLTQKKIVIQIEFLVDQILTLKKQNKNVDTKQLELQIDQMVYELYGLTKDEIKIVEGSNN